ncbi:putative ubiquitin-conjugating enzyme E2 T isoform 2 [Scophthalmus maximus]|uniref:Ubiquitin-conjugating enzyme E2 T n=1 Tax=Scophthalmus maximus TaxID=52904 RepID=A0A2U9C248_SCOMX|nr:putative ubiquitin-conjugating enzyme E2 T isoform 2 [Scophthalmus maximus]
MQRTSRLKRELQMLSTEPPPGITCWQTEERMDELRAQIVGGTGTPYEGGLFSLEIKVPERYPFEPPKMRFLTPIYHPNIDNSGRICHDALKLPPKGAWKPSLNISTVLSSIQLLMAEPNPDDPLMADIGNFPSEEATVYTGRCSYTEFAKYRPCASNWGHCLSLNQIAG